MAALASNNLIDDQWWTTGSPASGCCSGKCDRFCKWISGSRREIRPDRGRGWDRNTVHGLRLTALVNARFYPKGFYLRKGIQPENSWQCYGDMHFNSPKSGDRPGAVKPILRFFFFFWDEKMFAVRLSDVSHQGLLFKEGLYFNIFG